MSGSVTRLSLLRSASEVAELTIDMLLPRPVLYLRTERLSADFLSALACALYSASFFSID